MVSKLKTIKPKGKIFNFDFGTGECHLVKFGKCSLEKPFVERKAQKETDTGYCQQLFSDIIKNGQRDSIIIGEAGCGHYDFCDGRHRICIAQRKDLELLAEVEEYDELCSRCRPRSPSSNDVEIITLVDDSDFFRPNNLPKPKTGFKTSFKKQRKSKKVGGE